MKFILLALLTFIAITHTTEAKWEIRSNFELHISESLFDKTIGDFWSQLSGNQNIPIGDLTITPEGVPIQIKGVRAEVDYDFPIPQRIPGPAREWQLASNKLGGKLYVDQISASQTIVKEINGIIVSIRINAECHNIVLSLPESAAKVSAKIKADVVQSQIKLSFSDFAADWQAGAWKVDNIECSGDVDGFKEIVKNESLKALQTFQNFDENVHSALLTQFEEWSKDASLLLLSEKELPTGKDYLKVFYEPNSAIDTSNGLLLRGELRFEYPYIAPGQTITQNYELEAVSPSNEAEPMLILPFKTITALMMGEYFSGKLEYTLKAKEIPAFGELMNSFWKRFFAWPDLLNFHKDTQFAFQFLPMGPPNFINEKAGNTNAIQGDLTLPLAVRMFAPINGVYTPYVEFKTMLDGASTLTLLPEGKVSMQVKNKDLPLTYGWSKGYVSKYNPKTKIAVDKIGAAIKDSLNAEGFVLGIPTLTVGKSLELKPKAWKLEQGNLRLHFTTGN